MNRRVKKVLLFSSAWMLPAVLISIFGDYNPQLWFSSISVVIGVAMYEALYGD